MADYFLQGIVEAEEEIQRDRDLEKQWTAPPSGPGLGEPTVPKRQFGGDPPNAPAPRATPFPDPPKIQPPVRPQSASRDMRSTNNDKGNCFCCFVVFFLVVRLFYFHFIDHLCEPFSCAPHQRWVDGSFQAEVGDPRDKTLGGFCGPVPYAGIGGRATLVRRACTPCRFPLASCEHPSTSHRGGRLGDGWSTVRGPALLRPAPCSSLACSRDHGACWCSARGLRCPRIGRPARCCHAHH